MTTSIKSILESVDGLPQAMVESLEAVFESKVEETVQARVAEATETIKAESDEALKVAKEAAVTEILSQVDAFLDAEIGRWVSENAIAIDSNIKTQMAENLITTIVGTLAENDISRPESEHIIRSLEEQVDKQRQRSNGFLKESITLRKEIENLKRESIIKDRSQPLATTEAEKLVERSTKLPFVNEATFAESVDGLIMLIKAEGVNPKKPGMESDDKDADDKDKPKSENDDGDVDDDQEMDDEEKDEGKMKKESEDSERDAWLRSIHG